MKRFCALVLGLGANVLGLGANIVPFGMAHAADAQAGRQKLVVCQACHGRDGLSKNPEAPNLAGQVESYLVKALNDYKSGARQNETMNIVAKELSETDIENLAAYYSAIQVDVAPP